jgi:hypothetical protein
VNIAALELARTRADEIMSRVASALVEAEADRRVSLDAVAALRFLDSLEELLPSVPYAALRLSIQLLAHASPAVRRAVTGASRLYGGIAPIAAEEMLRQLAEDAEAPVRAAVARALCGLIAQSEDPIALVERWLAGSFGQREAVERARRRLPAPVGTAPARPGSAHAARPGLRRRALDPHAAV